MKWNDVNECLPDSGEFQSVDVWVCCGHKTYSAVFIQHEDEKGKFYIDIHFLHIFHEITDWVTHWAYFELPNELT